MSEKKKSTIRGLVIGIILILLVAGYYFYLSNRKPDAGKEEEVTGITPVQQALLKNFDNNYPPSPREVLKAYGDIIVCFYSEEYTDEELTELALQIQNLYDDDLIANDTPEQYQQNLRWDIQNLQDKNLKVTSYSVASATDVDYFTSDGYSWARLNCTFTIRSGKMADLSKEVFLLRKDEDGHWKIYGWKELDEEEGQE